MRMISPAKWPLAVMTAVFLLAATAARAEILLAPGDRISMKIIGVQDINAVATIDRDGTVSLPVVGSVPAAGRSASALRDDVARALSLEPIRLTGRNGEIWVKLDPSKIFLSVAEYRPVYVSGDVLAGGEKPFRPGMTARQALVLAGGPKNAVGDTSATELARTISDRRLVADLLDQARHETARLETALAELVARDAAGSPPADERPNTHLTAVENQWLATRSQLRDMNEQTTKLSLQRMRERLRVLEQLEGVNEETLQTFEQEFARMVDLADRGIATANSVTEARRGVLSFASRGLETAAESYKLKVDIVQTSDLNQAELTRERVETLEALLDRTARVQELQARLDALDVRQAFLTGRDQGERPAALTVVIYRRQDDGTERIEATLDTEITPGDVVEFVQIAGPTE